MSEQTEKYSKMINELMEFKDVGESFIFAGTTFYVISHSTFMPGGISTPDYHFPLLSCIYLDNNKVIHDYKFDHYMLPALKDQNPPYGLPG